jgi:hypothetical protein
MEFFVVYFIIAFISMGIIMVVKDEWEEGALVIGLFWIPALIILVGMGIGHIIKNLFMKDKK